jgi:hypothetical protein
MTPVAPYKRHPRDCYLTAPCVGLGLRELIVGASGIADELRRFRFLDPFGAAGFFLAVAAPSAKLKVLEIDTAWWRKTPSAALAWGETDAGRSLTWSQADAFAVPWTDGGDMHHIITNVPYGRGDEAHDRLVRHAAAGGFVASVIRTDYLQHPGRPEPDCLALLTWRPSFGFTLDKKTQRPRMATDNCGYAIAIWLGAGNPLDLRLPRIVYLKRPEVPKSLKDEHRRLALLAFEAGRADGVTA